MSQFYTTTPRAGAVTPLPNLAGTFVDEGYMKLVQLTSSDGSIQIYEAFDTTEQLFYYVKCTRSDTPPSTRLADEYAIHQSVAHYPGVATLHRMFEEDGLVFMVLNPAAGTMWESMMKRGIYVDQPRSIKEAFLQLVDAVAECHHAGVYHRGLRPRNIWCDSEGWRLRLANFGAATRAIESDEFGCGSLGYMSPECADASHGTYSPRESDLWALGVLLFNMITGSRPWHVADLSDTSYAGFRADEDTYFVETFHLTPAANDFFRRCFASLREQRPSLEEMAADVLAIDRFALAQNIVVKPHGHLHLSVLHATLTSPTAPDFRFLDREKRSITTRERIAKNTRRLLF
ncbi:kinase-like domain-containing protein [Mycena haematopus]|nr:kinase-like domain-containing protein [Mycena haematopus]